MSLAPSGVVAEMAANLHQRFPGWQRRLESLPDYTAAVPGLTLSC